MHAKSSKPARPTIAALIDGINSCGLPIDYSFLSLQSIDEALEEIPRFQLLRRSLPGKVKTSALKFNNNHLSIWSGLAKVTHSILLRPHLLSWLDLSFNKFRYISADLLEFKNLKIIYLHGNLISKLSDVEKLKGLPLLYSLTLHGNPLEREQQYRWKVLSILPNLKKFDFSAITPQERKLIEIFAKEGQPKKRI